MIGNQQNRDDGFVNVSTKVPPHVAQLLNIIAAAKGTDIYGLLQLFIQAIVRAAKVTTSISPEMKMLLHMIEIDSQWQHAFSMASPSAVTDVAQVILVLQQHDGKGIKREPRRGFGLVMIDKPYATDSEPTMTYCVDDILERVAEVSMPGLYKELRQVGISMDSESVRETLTMLCDAYMIEHLKELDQMEGPQLGTFHDFGKVIEYGARTKAHHHRTPDGEANRQMRIRFDDDDREQAELEVQQNIEDSIGCKPFDVEP